MTPQVDVRGDDGRAVVATEVMVEVEVEGGCGGEVDVVRGEAGSDG